MYVQRAKLKEMARQQDECGIDFINQKNNCLKYYLPLFLLDLVLPHVAFLFQGRTRGVHNEGEQLTKARVRKCLLT